MSANSENQTNPSSSSSTSNEAQKPPIEPIRLPTIEEIRGQDIWNNCAVRSVVSGVMDMSKNLVSVPAMATSAEEERGVPALFGHDKDLRGRSKGMAISGSSALQWDGRKSKSSGRPPHTPGEESVSKKAKNANLPAVFAPLSLGHSSDKVMALTGNKMGKITTSEAYCPDTGLRQNDSAIASSLIAWRLVDKMVLDADRATAMRETTHDHAISFVHSLATTLAYGQTLARRASDLQEAHENVIDSLSNLEQTLARLSEERQAAWDEAALLQTQLKAEREDRAIEKKSLEELIEKSKRQAVQEFIASQEYIDAVNKAGSSYYWDGFQHCKTLVQHLYPQVNLGKVKISAALALIESQSSVGSSA